MIESFLSKLESHIRREGYSIRTFEIHCGISNGTISRALRNNKQFQIEVLIKVAEKFPHWDFNQMLRNSNGSIHSIKSGQQVSPADARQDLLDEMIRLADKARRLKTK